MKVFRVLTKETGNSYRAYVCLNNIIKVLYSTDKSPDTNVGLFRDIGRPMMTTIAMRRLIEMVLLGKKWSTDTRSSPKFYTSFMDKLRVKADEFIDDFHRPKFVDAATWRSTVKKAIVSNVEQYVMAEGAITFDIGTLYEPNGISGVNDDLRFLAVKEWLLMSLLDIRQNLILPYHTCQTTDMGSCPVCTGLERSILVMWVMCGVNRLMDGKGYPVGEFHHNHRSHIHMLHHMEELAKNDSSGFLADRRYDLYPRHRVRYIKIEGIYFRRGTTDTMAKEYCGLDELHKLTKWGE